MIGKINGLRNSRGELAAFLQGDEIFAPGKEWIGWLANRDEHIYDAKGHYVATVEGDKIYVLRKMRGRLTGLSRFHHAVCTARNVSVIHQSFQLPTGAAEFDAAAILKMREVTKVDPNRPLNPRALAEDVTKADLNPPLNPNAPKKEGTRVDLNPPLNRKES